MLNWIAKRLTRVEYVENLEGHARRVGSIRYGLPMTIRIERDSDDAEAILRHELQHARDAIMTLGLAPMLKERFPVIKIWLEVRAYKAQGWTQRETISALMIAPVYKIRISPTDIRSCVERFW